MSAFPILQKINDGVDLDADVPSAQFLDICRKLTDADCLEVDLSSILLLRSRRSVQPNVPKLLQEVLSVVKHRTSEDGSHRSTYAFRIVTIVPLTHVCAHPEPALKTSAFPIFHRVIDYADLNVNVPAVLLRDASSGHPEGTVGLWLVPAYDHKDRFVERQPRTTAQSTWLIMRSKTVMTAVLKVRSGLDPHMIREWMDGWMDGWMDMILAGSHLDAA
ncbi:hypothetical protein EJB05_37055, partial [Eragrostis curvula]